MTTHYIVYKTTNTITGRFYIGSHQTKKLDDGYLGSGKILKQSIKKHGKQHFQREIIAYCVSPMLMRQIEAQQVRYAILNFGRACYNRSFSGVGGMLGRDNGFYGRKHTAETKAVISEKAKVHTKGENNGFYGKKHSAESIEKFKNAYHPTIDDCKNMLDGFKKRQTDWWCTPTGCYFSSGEAHRNTPGFSASSIKKWCSNSDIVFKANYQVPQEYWGKTPKELGWYRISVNKE